MLIYIPVACLTSKKRRWIISGNRILSALDNTDLRNVGVKRTCWTSRGFSSQSCVDTCKGDLQRVFYILDQTVRAEWCVRSLELKALKAIWGFSYSPRGCWKPEGHRSRVFTDGRITTRIRGSDEILQLSIKLIAVTLFLTGALPLGLNNSDLLLRHQTSKLWSVCNCPPEQHTV